MKKTVADSMLVNVRLSHTLASDLSGRADAEARTKTEMVRCALELYFRVRDAQRAGERLFLVRETAGKELVVL